MPEPLILASASPRRLQLLSQIGLSAEVQPADIDETALPGELAHDLVARLAVHKAFSIESLNAVILAADTVVECRGQILGKPHNREHAIDMLASLSDRTHQVISGVCVRIGAAQQSVTVQTDVTFGAISPDMAQRYWDCGESAGKAGAYAIQGAGALFVTRLAGSYSNVVGLPLRETARLLSMVGIHTSLGHI